MKGLVVKVRAKAGIGREAGHKIGVILPPLECETLDRVDNYG
jgi:hypothetical protein